jgi:hypothetical protein
VPVCVRAFHLKQVSVITFPTDEKRRSSVRRTPYIYNPFAEQKHQYATILIFIFPIVSLLFSFVVPNQALRVQAWTDPVGSSRWRLPEFLDNRHTKVVRLSALCTGRLYLPPPPRKYFWYPFLLEAESTPRAIMRSDGLRQ